MDSENTNVFELKKKLAQAKNVTSDKMLSKTCENIFRIYLHFSQNGPIVPGGQWQK